MTYTGIIPYLQLSSARDAAALYQQAFAAKTTDIREIDGKVIHAALRINGGWLFLCDPFPEHGHPLQPPQGYTLHLQVDDADRWFARATAAGLTVAMPMELQFWGDRYGQLRDRFGVMWSVGSTPT